MMQFYMFELLQLKYFVDLSGKSLFYPLISEVVIGNTCSPR